MAEKKAKGPAKPRTRKRRAAAEAKSRGLSASEMTAEAPADVRKLMEQIESDGGNPLASYREPLGGSWVVMAALRKLGSRCVTALVVQDPQIA